MGKLKKGSVIWICRHGERVDNVSRNWREDFPHLARDNPPMNDRGRTQAKEVGERLAQEPGFDHIFSSPFRRCVETAHIIAQATGNTIKIEPGICEILYRFPPGFEPAESMHKEYDSIDLTYKPMGVTLEEEAYDEDVQERVSETLKRIFSVHSGQILLVGHGASVGGMIKELSGSWSYVGQCTLTKFIYEGGSDFMHGMRGNADHLSDKTNLRVGY